MRFAAGFATFLLAFGLRRDSAGLGWYAFALGLSAGGSLVGLAFVTRVRNVLRESTLLTLALFATGAGAALAVAASDSLRAGAPRGLARTEWRHRPTELRRHHPEERRTRRAGSHLRALRRAPAAALGRGRALARRDRDAASRFGDRLLAVSRWSPASLVYPIGRRARCVADAPGTLRVGYGNDPPRAAVSEELAVAPHVVVVGGGFAGVAVVRTTGRPSRCASPSSTATTSTPSCPCSTRWRRPDSSPPTSPTRSARSSATRATFRCATRSCAASTRRATSSCSMTATEIAYDHLVVATGGGRGVLQHRRRPRELRDAALHAGRRAAPSQPAAARPGRRRGRRRARRHPRLNFVVVGGGPTGVETAGALVELIEIAIKRDGLRLDPSRVRVTLVDVASRLLTAFPERASAYAQCERFERFGVDVELVAVGRRGRRALDPIRRRRRHSRRRP